MTTAGIAPSRWHMRESTLLALLLHLMVLVAIFPLALSSPALPPQPMTVEVTLVRALPEKPLPPAAVPPQPAAAEPPSSIPAATYPPPTSSKPSEDIRPDIKPATTTRADGLRDVHDFYAAAALSDPRSAVARTKLKSVAPADRVIQICNLELMQQAQRADPSRHPDFVVAYATADVIERGLTVEAKGAALHSGQQWLRARYTCTASGDMEGVVKFAYAITEAIPEAQWEELNLPSKIDADDE